MWELPLPGLDTDAMQALNGYDFPGNVRELENILERAITLAEGSLIKTTDLQLPDSAQPLVAGRAVDTRRIAHVSG